MPTACQDPSAPRLLRPPTYPRELTTAPENSVVGAKPLDMGGRTIESSKTIGGLSIEGEMQRLPPPITRDIATTEANAGTAANIVGPTTHWAD